MQAWTDFLRGGAPGGHAAQIYGHVDELAESVVSYLCAGFDAGEPAVVIATRENLGVFIGRLAESGCETGRVEHEGLLVVADADATLRSIMRNGSPSEIAFEAVVGTLLDQLGARFPGRNIRAFGEMVSLLCERGQTEDAIALEELWNNLGQRRPFSLLCGYRLSLFDRASQLAPLPDVCRLHSHVAPAPDDARLGRAVDQALDEVLGHAGAGQVYALVGDRARQKRVPIAQLALMWVSANMPALADRILATAQARYLADPAASATV